MSNEVSHCSGSSGKQRDLTKVDSDAEDKIAGNLIGPVPMRQLNGGSICSHVSPEPTPAKESVNVSTDMNHPAGALTQSDQTYLKEFNNRL